jgi:hypothetical protein
MMISPDARPGASDSVSAAHDHSRTHGISTIGLDLILHSGSVAVTARRRHDVVTARRQRASDSGLGLKHGLGAPIRAAGHGGSVTVTVPDRRGLPV